MPRLAAFPTLAYLVWSCLAAWGQEPQPEVTIHAATNLVLVDVIALRGATQRPDMSLQRGDFLLYDNGHPVSIKTFDSGARARPLALWFVVQCTMKDWEKQGSALFHGQVDLLKPALGHLVQADMVAVAHWCDDGQAKIDLTPTNDVNTAISAVEQVLTPIVDPASHSRSGELALQKTLQLIVDSTRSLPHDTVPVLVFLYGDYSAMPRPEADQFIDELLGSSAIAFGLRDNRSPRIHGHGGEQGAIAKYFATQTGGQYFTATPESYASTLEQILEQMHSRYELGFRPETLDGQRHSLLVKLSPAARKSRTGLRLRCRTAYIPLPNAKP